MFQPEFDETEPPPARLGIPAPPAVRPALRPTPSRNPMTQLMARLGNHRLGYRPVSTVGIATISMILLGSALLSRGDVSALLDDLVFGRDDTSPVLEVRPRAVVTQDAAVVPASTPTPVTSTKRPAKVQQPRQPGRNLVANVIPRTRVRDTAPPRPSRPGRTRVTRDHAAIAAPRDAGARETRTACRRTTRGAAGAIATASCRSGRPATDARVGWRTASNDSEPATGLLRFRARSDGGYARRCGDPQSLSASVQCNGCRRGGRGMAQR